jgi:hypothetical protein
MDWFFSNTIIPNSKKINFENMQYAIKNPNVYIILNTLSLDDQNCLIQGTLPASKEEQSINEMITQSNIPDKKIILYGRNTNDITVQEKYKQLIFLGISDIFVYSGGLFEWLLLQDIYGIDEFPTTSKLMDILKYKSMPCIL